MKTYQLFLGLFFLLSSLSCGQADDGLVCGSLSATLPTVEDIGSGQVSWEETQIPYAEPGTWSDGSNGDITFSTISMVIAKDETGENTDGLIEAGLFPICIPLGERSEQSGNATDTGTFVTDANNEGMIAILGQEDEEIIGRFFVTMGNAAGETRALENGLFRIPQR